MWKNHRFRTHRDPDEANLPEENVHSLPRWLRIVLLAAALAVLGAVVANAQQVQLQDSVVGNGVLFCDSADGVKEWLDLAAQASESGRATFFDPDGCGKITVNQALIERYGGLPVSMSVVSVHETKMAFITIIKYTALIDGSEHYGFASNMVVWKKQSHET